MVADEAKIAIVFTYFFVKTQLNSTPVGFIKTQLNSSWFDHIMGIVTHPPGKLLYHFQTNQEAGFRHATLF